MTAASTRRVKVEAGGAVSSPTSACTLLVASLTG